jgi:hypothetical protein
VLEGLDLRRDRYRQGIESNARDIAGDGPSGSARHDADADGRGQPARPPAGRARPSPGRLGGVSQDRSIWPHHGHPARE